MFELLIPEVDLLCQYNVDYYPMTIVSDHEWVNNSSFIQRVGLVYIDGVIGS